MSLRESLVRGLLSIVVIAVAVVAITDGRTFFSVADKAAAPGALEPALSGLSSANSAERASAVKALAASHDTAAAPALLNMLDDSDQTVGLYVAQTLGELAPASLLPQLRAELNSSNADVRWRAALALGTLRDKGAVTGLRTALDDSDPSVPGRAAEALAQIGTPAAIQALVDGLGSAHATTVYATMDGLETLKESAVPAVSQALLNSSQAQVRLNAATVLGYIGSAQARPALQLATIDKDSAVETEVQWALNQLPQ